MLPIMLDQTFQAVIFGVVAASGCAFALGTWRRGWVIGLVCGLTAFVVMWLMLLPFLLPFQGLRLTQAPDAAPPRAT